MIGSTFNPRLRDTIWTLSSWVPIIFRWSFHFFKYSPKGGLFQPRSIQKTIDIVQPSGLPCTLAALAAFAAMSGHSSHSSLLGLGEVAKELFCFLPIHVAGRRFFFRKGEDGVRECIRYCIDNYRYGLLDLLGMEDDRLWYRAFRTRKNETKSLESMVGSRGHVTNHLKNKVGKREKWAFKQRGTRTHTYIYVYPEPSIVI